MTLVVDHLFKRFGSVVALDDLAFEVPPGQVVRIPRRERRRQDDDDADRPRRARARRRPGHLARRREPPPAALDLGLPARGARPVPADAGPGAARVLRRASTACRPTAPGATRSDWLRRFRAEDLADRRAEQLSKGNQQKIQFIAAVLHDPQVLLMDEPFTGLDPVNVMLLREAFLELRDRGRTVVFSTHQMEVAEALCESVAIVDRGRVVVGGPMREVRRATGRRMVRISVGGRPSAAVAGRPAGDADDPGGHGPLDGRARRRARAGCGPRRRHRAPAPRSSTSRSPTPASSRCSSTTSGHPADEETHLAPVDGEEAAAEGAAGADADRAASRRGRGRGVTGSPHAVPPAPPEAMPESSNGTNVGLVARREYVERVRSRAFVFSTLLLIGLAVVVALIPLGVRLLDRATVTQVGVVADDAALAARAVGGHGQRAQRAAPGRGPGRAEVRLRAAHGRGRDGRGGPQRRARRRHPHRPQARQAASTSRC